MIDDEDRSRLFWRIQLASWTVYGLLAGAFMGVIYFDVREMLVINLCRTSFGLLATCALRLPYRWIRRRSLPIGVSGCGVFLLCGALAMLDGEAIRFVVRVFDLPIGDKLVHQFVFTSMPMRWMVYWLWSLLYFGLHLWLDMEKGKLREAEARAEAQENELLFLRSQINPHFLFNALNTILAETPNPQTRTLIQALADYLRFSLCQHPRRAPLGMELDALANYLAVEKARFLEKLDYRIEITEEARQALAPVACIQPLLENAMKYGRQTSPDLLKLEISGRVDGGRLHVRVWNSGRWIAPEAHTSTRTGLDNLRRRLALLFRGDATLHLAHDAPGVSAEISLPLTPLTPS